MCSSVRLHENRNIIKWHVLPLHQVFDRHKLPDILVQTRKMMHVLTVVCSDAYSIGSVHWAWCHINMLQVA